MSRKNGAANAARRRGLRQELRLIWRRAEQVWKLVPWQHKGLLFGAALLMALTSLAGTAIPLFLGTLVDRIRSHTAGEIVAEDVYGTTVFYLGLIAGAYLVREALNVLRRWLVEDTSTRLDRDMTVRVVSSLMKADLATFSQDKVGALHGRISRSVEGFVRFVRLSFLTFFPALLTGLFALGAVVWKEPWVGLVMLGVIPTSVWLTVWQLMSQRGVRLKLLRTREEMDGTVVEQLNGLDYVRAANTHKIEVKRVARTAERRRVREIRHHVEMALFGCAKALNDWMFHVIVLALAIHLAVQGTISFGDVVTFSMLFLNVMTPLAEVHRVIDEGHECSLRVGDLMDILSEPADRSFQVAEAKEPHLNNGHPLVEIQDLHVEYDGPDGSRRSALGGLSLQIRHGETIGVAGRSGCGKSTWLKVLMRLTHPASGHVRIGGVPLEELPREAIGRLIGYVGQSPFVFSGTIADNIAYGSNNASPEQIEAAARLAHLHDEIMAMPGGYEAAVTERGANLSGGQRQRIALARVFLKDPPILILDEGTSALDNISEWHVQRAIAAAQDDRTVILVAHRLTTLLEADRIFVFHEGRLVEEGSYQELMAKNGAFTALDRHAGGSLAQS